MFSYEDYKQIIRYIQESGREHKFPDAVGQKEFILMRHDVEFSVERAYQLSKVEDACGFTSTWFFQWTNNAYNLLSRRNRDILNEMKANGHTIGLHYATCGETDMTQIIRNISKEIRMLSEMLNMDIDQFSVHRPTKEILRENIHLPGIYNAYQDDFFSFAENVTSDTVLDVRYFSDARHQWNYGLIPNPETLDRYPKIQILTHPYSWTENGYDSLNNFRTLIAEHTQELKETIDGECNHFALIKDML